LQSFAALQAPANDVVPAPVDRKIPDEGNMPRFANSVFTAPSAIRYPNTAPKNTNTSPPIDAVSFARNSMKA
jgi:hypothetical protein